MTAELLLSSGQEQRAPVRASYFFDSVRKEQHKQNQNDNIRESLRVQLFFIHIKCFFSPPVYTRVAFPEQFFRPQRL